MFCRRLPLADQKRARTRIVLSSGLALLPLLLAGCGNTPVKPANPGAVVVLSASSLTFPSTAVGVSSTQSLTLTNTGTAALQLSTPAVSVAGQAATSPFTATTTCTPSVAMEVSCSVTVTFSSTLAGTFTGTLSVGDSATGAPQTVPVTATATSSGATSSGTTTGAAAASNIYVLQQGAGAGAVLQFPATSTGVATPTATITPAGATALSAIATDTTGQLYIAGYIETGGFTTSYIWVYAPGATSTSTPVRTITSAYPSSSSFGIPTTMVVGANSILYVLSTFYSGTGTQTTIAGLSSTASGAALPVSLLTQTALADPQDLAVDAAGNLYVTNIYNPGTGGSLANTGQLYIFAAGSTGAATPARIITSSQVFFGVATDGAQNIYAIENAPTGATNGSIVEFTAGATGAATPSKTITGTATGLTFGGGLSLDAVNNLYAINAVGVTTGAPTFSVLGFASTATGNAAPSVKFSSAALTIASGQIAVH